MNFLVKSDFCYLTPRVNFSLYLFLSFLSFHYHSKYKIFENIIQNRWNLDYIHRKLFWIFWWSQINFCNPPLGLISLSLSLISLSPFPLKIWNFRKCSPKSMKFRPNTQKIILNLSVKLNFCYLTPGRLRILMVKNFHSLLWR